MGNKLLFVKIFFNCEILHFYTFAHLKRRKFEKKKIKALKRSEMNVWRKNLGKKAVKPL